MISKKTRTWARDMISMAAGKVLLSLPPSDIIVGPFPNVMQRIRSMNTASVPHSLSASCVPCNRKASRAEGGIGRVLELSRGQGQRHPTSVAGHHALKVLTALEVTLDESSETPPIIIEL